MDRQYRLTETSIPGEAKQDQAFPGEDPQRWSPPVSLVCELPGLSTGEASGSGRTRAAPAAPRLRFGLFEADLGSGELTKNGRRVRLQEQPFQLLAVLLEHPGQLVTRQQLQEVLWPQTTVDYDHGLNKAVSKIRDALGDSADSPRFVETVASRGYRFLADVTVVNEQGHAAPVAADPIAPASSTDVSPTPARNRLGGYALGFAAAVVIAGGLAWFARPARPALPTVRAIAVLPLTNIAKDASQDFFADGMTDELITQLGRISAIRVISRSSAMAYKDTSKPLAEIARELHVDAVVEGSVLREGDRVRISAQLIQAPDDAQVWAESYEGDLRDTLTLQSKVAQAIARQIKATVNRQEQAALEKTRVVNPQAYENYLKGRYFWNKRTGDDLKKAIGYFRKAVEIDPGYAEAYSGLADTYTLSGDWEYGVLSTGEAFSKATAAASHALQLDNGLGEAHTSLAFALDLYGWDWDIARSEYQLAIDLNPGYATAHHWYAWHLMLMGRTEQAIAELTRAQALDPLSLIIGADIADAFCIAHAFDEAIRQSRKTLELDPRFAVGHYELGQALVQTHDFDQAIAEFEKAIEISGHSAVFDSNLAYAYAVSGRKPDAIGIARDLESQHDRNPFSEASIALIYVGLGDFDAALKWLDKAYDQRFNPSILLRPAFDPLRSDARFKELLHRIGLPA
jgi:TolB-like protein/DNA-binding winged helix-turn-helix (wHTH) protein/Flp pilus assembly protein TadD